MRLREKEEKELYPITHQTLLSAQRDGTFRLKIYEIFSIERVLVQIQLELQHSKLKIMHSSPEYL